jgi:hypothetical protein
MWTGALSGVELKNTGYFFVSMFAGLQCEIRRCYIHDAYGFPAQWDGDGVMMNYGTSWCRIEDNIGDRTNYLVLTQRSSANAILYNHFWESGQFAADANMQHALSCNHLQHCVMNLWEGNIAEQITNDGYHGTTSHQVIFRNNFHGDHPSVTGMRKMVDLCRGSYYHSALGNVLGSSSWEPSFYSQTGEPGNDETATIYRLGYPNGGNNDLYGGPTWIGYPAVYPDSTVTSTLIRHANYDYYNNAVVWGDADHTIEDSLIYSSKPDYFGELNWPPIGPDVSGYVQQTPAKWRWDTYVVSNDLDDLFADSPSNPTGFTKEHTAFLTISTNEVARLYVDIPKQRVVANSPATYTIRVEAWNDFVGNITLDMTGLPAGATDTYGTNPIAYNGTTTVTVATTGVSAGTYPLHITGTSAGGDVASVKVILEIVSSADFDLKIPIRRIRAKQGDNAVFTIKADSISGYTDNIDLSVSGVPSGATPTFADDPLAYNGTTTLTIATGAAAVGTHEIVITGEGPV